MSETILTPSTPEEVEQVVGEALKEGTTLAVTGAGSKSFFGEKPQASTRLSLAGLGGILEYQPSELIMVARPGTPLKTVEAALAKEGQMLAFEPPHWAEGATLGGVIGTNLSGPRRVTQGAARDHLLGFQAVSGRGETFRGGGKVVKNVTGYDMSKLMCGSFGTLGVMTELAVKVLPAPDTEKTLVVAGLSEKDGVAFLRAAAGTPHEPSAMTHLPEGYPEGCLPAELAGYFPQSLTFVRISGPEPSVAHRLAQLSGMAPGETLVLENAPTRQLWKTIGETEPVMPGADHCLWRFSLAATESVALAGGVEKLAGGRGQTMYDWAGALLWLTIPADAPVEKIQALARDAGGSAQVVRGEVPQGTTRFSPLPAAQMKIHRELKKAFDPAGILNPGRMYPGL